METFNDTELELREIDALIVSRFFDYTLGKEPGAIIVEITYMEELYYFAFDGHEDLEWITNTVLAVCNARRFPMNVTGLYKIKREDLSLESLDSINKC